ncbi:carboxypeptidase regulatory-like domain-containing protein [Pandoraea terrigena]|uniref:Carboxypeptidase regulatory-like domain-containing protein n=1 Tax=Pandoraea terrigena TaxID=2508292 RepID=A0A5E4X7Z6_9BURK|nr:carboxypeptidase regulatory-like domain-containing protein [Pandoraea terrigena]VVE32362.1 carboxypeptidase regulatory-like domain-containing protein [Pandoraea terrigena]
MRQQWQRWSMAAAAVVALAGGLGISVAHAQGGTLPPSMQQGEVTYVSGGIDSDQSGAFKREASHWPLSIEMAARGDGANEYVADAQVQIMRGSKTVLDARSKGPFMLVKLPEGSYTVKATYDGKLMTREVKVPAKGHAAAMFLWPHD